MKKIFLDANILIGLLYNRDRIHRESVAVVGIVLKKYKAYISPSTFVICQRKLRKLVPDVKKRENAISTLLSAFKYTTENQEVMDFAKSSSFHNKEDAVQYYSAEVSGMDAIITEDVFDFQPYAGLPIYHPVEFLQLEILK